MGTRGPHTSDLHLYNASQAWTTMAESEPHSSSTTVVAQPGGQATRNKDADSTRFAEVWYTSSPIRSMESAPAPSTIKTLATLESINTVGERKPRSRLTIRFKIHGPGDEEDYL